MQMLLYIQSASKFEMQDKMYLKMLQILKTARYILVSKSEAAYMNYCYR